MISNGLENHIVDVVRWFVNSVAIHVVLLTEGLYLHVGNVLWSCFLLSVCLRTILRRLALRLVVTSILTVARTIVCISQQSCWTSGLASQLLDFYLVVQLKISLYGFLLNRGYLFGLKATQRVVRSRTASWLKVFELSWDHQLFFKGLSLLNQSLHIKVLDILEWHSLFDGLQLLSYWTPLNLVHWCLSLRQSHSRRYHKLGCLCLKMLLIDFENALTDNPVGWLRLHAGVNAYLQFVERWLVVTAETEHNELVLFEVLRHLHELTTKHESKAVRIHIGRLTGVAEVLLT